MMVTPAPPRLRLHDNKLAWWIVASLLAHMLLVKILPGWQAAHRTPLPPLQVELREKPPPQIIPAEPLPLEPEPRPKPALKPAPVKAPPLAAAPREERLAEPPRAAAEPPAPPEAPAAPQAPLVAEQKPASPTAASQPPRAPAAPEPPLAPAALAPVFNAAYLNNPKPEYPPTALRRGETGTVYLLVLVTKDGKAARVSLQKSSGSASLDEAARRAVMGWRFEPGRKGAQPLESEVVVPVAFNIKDAR